MADFMNGRYWMASPKAGVATNDKGTLYFYIEGEITYIVDESEAEPRYVELPDPKKRTVFLYLTDAAKEITMERLASIGFNGDFDNPRFSQAIQDADGLEVICKNETYEGKTRDRWSLPGGAGSGGIEHKPVDELAKRRLKDEYANKFGKAAGIVRKPGPPVAARSNGAAAPVATGGDVDL